jgi:hypothetical protein
MWYLNRSGNPEGPLSEAQIIEMIQFGGLREAHVCPAGGQSWMPLNAHPAFAQVMTGIAPTMMSSPHVAPQPYGAPVQVQQAPSPYGAPQGPQAGPQGAQGAQGYGFAQAQPAPAAYGAPQASYGQGQNMGQPQGMPSPPAKKSKLPLVLGLGGALVAVTGIGTGAYFALRSSGPNLAKSMPANTQVYLEATGFKESLQAVKRMNFVDGSKFDDVRSLEDAKVGFQKAFDLSSTDASLVALGIKGAGGGGWNIGRNRGESVFLISWDSATSAKILLSSKRFSSEGLVGSGTFYKVVRRDVPYDQMSSMSALEKSLSQLSTSGKTKLAWFDKAKVMAIGDEASLRDIGAVVDGTSPSLAKSDLYGEAKKSFVPDAQIIGFGDPMIMRETSREAYDKYFAGSGPMALSAKAQAEGLKITFSGSLGGAEIQKQKDAFIFETAKLELGRTLPQETVAFFDMSTKVAKRGKEGRALLIRAITQNAPDGGASMQQEIERVEKESGIDIGDVLSAVGGEGVIAVAARAGFTYNPKVAVSWKDFAVVYEQKLEDEAAAKKIMTTLRSKAVEAKAPVKITIQGDNFTSEPASDSSLIPRVDVRYIKKTLFLVLGSQALAERVFAASEGTATLGDDAAFKTVSSKTEAKNALLWVDSGRAAQAFLDAEPTTKSELSKAGVPLDAFFLTGEKRVTSTLGMTTEFKGDKLMFTVDSVNLPMAGALMAGASMLRLGSGLGTTASSFDPAATNLPGTGNLPKECNAYLAHYQRCLLKVGQSPADTAKTIGLIRESYSKLPAATVAPICVTADAGVSKSFKNCL